MVDRRDLRTLSPARFGDVIAAVLADAWPGTVDTAPASPAGNVDAVVSTDGSRRLVHVRQDGRIDAAVVRELSAHSTGHGFDSTTLVTTGLVADEVRTLARAVDVTLVDGRELAGMVEAAAVDGAGEPTAASLAARLATGWPESLRERAVELALTIDAAADFDREVTADPERTDVDFTPVGDRDPVLRMRFTRTSLLLYVRRGDRFYSVVRLTVFREVQPPLGEVAAELETHLRVALAGRSEDSG